MGSGFRTFQSGEVLTSSNVQNFLMDQSVTVFAGTASRGSAIASPETGMVSYRTDGTADSKREGFEFYDGASWVRLIPAAGGLELISSTTIGTTVSSVTVSNVFSSTYDNYRVIVSGGVASTEVELNLTLGNTSTGYYWAVILRQYTSATVTADQAANNLRLAYAGRGTTNSLSAVFDVLAPNLAKNTHFIYANSGAETANSWVSGGGYLADTTQYTAFTLTPNSGTLTGGTVKVYGYKN